MREGKYLIKTTTTAELQAVTAALRGTHQGSPPHNNKRAPPNGQRDNTDADVGQLRTRGHAWVRNGPPV